MTHLMDVIVQSLLHIKPESGTPNLRNLRSLVDGSIRFERGKQSYHVLHEQEIVILTISAYDSYRQRVRHKATKLSVVDPELLSKVIKWATPSHDDLRMSRGY